MRLRSTSVSRPVEAAVGIEGPVPVWMALYEAMTL
jgi:hypothetical protein